MQLPESFFHALEMAVLELSQHVTAPQAVRMLLALMADASSELVEVFDRIIGKNIDELSASEVFYAYMGFSYAERAQVRPKIFGLLIKRLSNCLELLNMEELCTLALITAKNGSQQDL